MTCISPPAPEDRQLLAYLDGEADEDIAAHIAACAYCQERVEALRKLQNSLTARLYRLECPETETLGDYQMGLLPAARMASVAQHVQDCLHCARELAQLRDYLRELAPPTTASPFEGIKILVARLAGEGRQAGLGPAVTRLRGAGKEPVTLEADGILIVLDVQPQAGTGFSILGQVAAEDQERWTGAQVELRQSGLLLGQARIDDLGAFRFEGIPPGPAQLQLLPEGGPAVLAQLEIQD